MDIPFPPGPRELPAGLTTPNRAYKRGVWLALFALALFVGLYLSLLAWLGFRTYGFLAAAVAGSNTGGGYLAALPTLFLFIFLGKALFFRDKDKHRQSFQVTPEEEPALFAFLHRVADEAGAPRPHKVFLAPDVNAGVFYDVSVLNFVFPSRKNLRIGLGLVNSVTLSEFKAVLAHEFGHFGQRAMAVGSWVYTAQRIAGHIVHRRDVMDRFLLGISRFDVRVAWIGWIMRTIVWSLRSVLDTAFTLAVLAQRALTRKMEFQADLVAVSLAGSDTIVHALNKLGPADDAFDQAASLVLSEHRQGRKVKDLYVVQAKALERMRVVLGKPFYGANPPLPEAAPEQHRLFERHMAAPPRMWSTHPSNEDREENAKRVYVPAPADDRTAWELFRDPTALRQRMTALLVETVTSEEGASTQPSPETPREEVDGLAALAEGFDRPHLDPVYRGTYLGRSVVRAADKASELFPPTLPERQAWSPTYADEMTQDIARLKTLEEEHDLLLGLQRGLLEAGGRSLQYQGKVLRRRDLPNVLEGLAAERSRLRGVVADHDRRVRGIHLAAAEAIGQGWPEYLRGAAALLHYADHTEANLGDAAASYRNVFNIVTADGKVSKAEASRLVAEGTALQAVLSDIQAQAKDVSLPDAVVRRLGETSWQAALPDHLGLPPPSQENLGEWNEVLGGWLSSYGAPLDVLERAALDHLLDTERDVMRMATGEAPVSPAPAPPHVPSSYATLPPGREREKQWRLGWWDRFQVADGFGPQLARLAVAGAVVACFVWGISSVDRATIVVHNGLGRDVIASVNGEDVFVPARSTTRVERAHHASIPISARTDAGVLIESFTAHAPYSMETYVYNVAGADALVRWDAVYGSLAHTAQPQETVLGAPRFLPTDATVLFEEPPRSVKTKSGSAIRKVIENADVEPEAMLRLAKSNDERHAMIAAHAVYDRPDRHALSTWLWLAHQEPDGEAIAARRLQLDGRDLLAQRLLQDLAKGDVRTKRCADYQTAASSHPDDGDAAYLAIRCLPDGPAQDEAFLTAHGRFPAHPWIAQAAAYALASRGDDGKAVAIFQQVAQVPALPELVVLDTARLLRLQGQLEEAKRLRQYSQTLASYLMMEEPSPPSNILAAYASMAKGEIDKALELSNEKPYQHRMLRLAAASAGAPAGVVKQALALADQDSIDVHTLWPTIGLRLREKLDVTALLDAIPRHARPEAVPVLRRCVEVLSKGTRERELRGMLAGLLPVERGHVLVMAAVALGERAPRSFRDDARKLLFVPERPAL
jgi:Zn-dependent protease with chaperone function